MTRHPRLVVFAACALAAAAPLSPAPAFAQVTVFDPSNYAQNLLTAARSLQQVNNQLTALQNQARMLQNQALQLKSLDYTALAPMRDAMARIDRLMTTAEGAAIKLASTEASLDQLFPEVGSQGAASTSQIVGQARAQARAAMDAYRQALKVQAQVVENIQGDAPLIAQLVGASQDAAGGLQAQQAANQLQALAIKQDQQLQAMVAAQYRADAMERARQAQVLEAGKRAARAFVGDGQAYSAN
jgi:P-type conjugative transfer protein TrbJ